TFLALEPAGPGHQLGDRKAAGFVDIEGQRLQLDRVVADLLEISLVDAAAADRARGNAGALGDDTGGELLGRHFAGEEADHAAVGRLGGAVGLHLRYIGFGDVEGDVGGKRRFAHAGATGDDDQIGGLQAAHLGVEITQPRGDA